MAEGGDSRPLFIIQGEGMGLQWSKLIHRMILEEAFKDKTVYFDYDRSQGRPDLVVRSTHEWYKQTSDNYFHKSDDPLDPFFEYDCPYVSWSGEPLRCHLKPGKLPLMEFNTYKKIPDLTRTDIDDPYSPELYENTIWWGERLYYFDNEATKTHWIPYCMLLPPDLDYRIRNFRLPEGQSFENLVEDKTADFVYLASNCNQPIREAVFQKLFEAYERTPGDGVRKVHRFGRCPPERDDIPRQPFPEGVGWWVDNWKVYHPYKFTLAFENSLNPGYVTEKIAMAFLSGSIPVYYGPPEVFEFFNEDAFFYVNRYFRNPFSPTEEELDELVYELEMLAKDDSENGWKKYLRQPVFRGGVIPERLRFKEGNPTREILEVAQQLRIYYDMEIGEPIARVARGPPPGARGLVALAAEVEEAGGEPAGGAAGAPAPSAPPGNQGGGGQTEGLEPYLKRTLPTNVKERIFSTTPADAFNVRTIESTLEALKQYTPSNSNQKQMKQKLLNGFSSLEKKARIRHAEQEALGVNNEALEVLGARPMQSGGKRKKCSYRPNAKNRKTLKRYKRGESIGFTLTASLKAKGLIPRTSKEAKGKKIVSKKYCTRKQRRN